jgi:hypothetical protein
MKMDANDQLFNALTRVRIDAKKQLEKAEARLAGKPLYGWSQEKHEAYHLKEIAECRAVLHYTEIRQMQIFPD